MADEKERDHLPDLITEWSPKIQFHVNKFKKGGLPPHIDHEDLHGAGMVGFYRALESYKPSGGSKFSSWASMKIEKAMQEHITSGGGDSSAVDYSHYKKAKKFASNQKAKKASELPED